MPHLNRANTLLQSQLTSLRYLDTMLHEMPQEKRYQEGWRNRVIEKIKEAKANNAAVALNIRLAGKE